MSLEAINFGSWILSGSLPDKSRLSGTMLFLQLTVYVTMQFLLPVRAQSSILCLGSNTVSQVFAVLLDGYRPLLTENDPLLIGDGEKLGVFNLLRGRVHNVNETRFRKNLSVRCNGTHMDLNFPLTITSPRVVYDIRRTTNIIPLSGELHITMDIIDLDVALVANRNKDQGSPVVSSLEILRMPNFKMAFVGLGTMGYFLNMLFSTAHSVEKLPLNELFRVLLWRALQRYVDDTPLPI
ncbi:uncharacterized protein LOC135367610 [Ornithodoros turicata]|uniref:uncharacterized protein LOC135367610 n=1 Tax=Ornithodoros turicata TaxID=34597 RepID=UPI003138E257